MGIALFWLRLEAKKVLVKQCPTATIAYTVKARGNTDNAGQVTVSGKIDADGGDPI